MINPSFTPNFRGKGGPEGADQRGAEHAGQLLGRETMPLRHKVIRSGYSPLWDFLADAGCCLMGECACILNMMVWFDRMGNRETSQNATQAQLWGGCISLKRLNKLAT
jgi:hypothetical protein